MMLQFLPFIKTLQLFGCHLRERSHLPLLLLLPQPQALLQRISPARRSCTTTSLPYPVDTLPSVPNSSRCPGTCNHLRTSPNLCSVTSLLGPICKLSSNPSKSLSQYPKLARYISTSILSSCPYLCLDFPPHPLMPKVHLLSITLS